LSSLRSQVFAAAEDGRVAHSLALWTLPSGWAASALQKERGVPYSVWALGSDIWSLGKLAAGRVMLRRVIRGATRRYADGLQLADDAARISGQSFSFLPSTRVLPGTRMRALASSPPYRLFFLGRWHPNKGIDLMLDALALLDDRAWSKISEVHIAGGGPMEAQVREKVTSLRASGHPLRLDGYLDRSEATRALERADWLLLPSRIESIPVVFSDAMKMGLPVVSMPVGDLPALVAQHSVGTVSTRVDAAAFAEAIANAMEHSPSELAGGIAACAAEFELRPRTLLSELGLTGKEDDARG
jgi:glycosyltransferase involved in cell wall biosynthesis